MGDPHMVSKHALARGRGTRLLFGAVCLSAASCAARRALSATACYQLIDSNAFGRGLGRATRQLLS